MPKRSSSDATAKGGLASFSTNQPFVQRKTERSHEENQERAYIAASRRSDRSLEARVQSARMASEIHKKRTGKSFHITEEIVRKEEMYEEEEDEFPRSYRVLGSHMQTASPEMNSKLEAYMSSRLAMSAYMSKMNDQWRENNINQMFAAAFPNLGQQAQQLSPGMYSDTQSQQAQSPVSPTFQRGAFETGVDKSGSFSVASPAEQSNENPLSPSTLTTTQTSNPTSPEDSQALQSFTPVKAALQTDFGRSTESPFTSELPQEMKLLMTGPSGMDMTSFGNQSMYGQPLMAADGFYNPDMSGVNKLGEIDEVAPDFYGEDSWDALTQPMDEPWDTFINDAAWDNNLQ